jgi:hypothetical protein
MDNSILAENQSSLASEATKRIIGERNIDLWQTYKANSRGASRRARTGGFLNMLGQGALDYLMSNLTQIIMGSILTLYVFDWNQTDAEIKAQMEANDLAMLTASGRLAADGIVRFAAMGAVKQAKHRYPRIDPYALAQLEEDNQEELISQLRSFLLAARGNIVSNTALSTYMSGRAMMFGAKTQKTESFIVSDQIQKIAESQKDPKIKAFLSGFVSQAEDTIFELAYLVVNTIQATYEMNRLAARQGLGPHRVVQFTPDASDPSVKTLLYGPQEQIMGEITSAVNQQAILDQKDLGTIAQVGIDTALKATRNERQAVAYFYSGVNGATTLPDGKRALGRVMRLSNLKISVDWDSLKSTLTPFDGGNYKVIAHLDDGHNLTGFFASESEGKSYLTKVSALCNGDIKKWTTIEPNSDVRFRIPAGRFTVSTVTLRIAKHTSDEAKKTYIDSFGQVWKVKAIKLPLRRDEKPEGIDATILNPWGDTPP